MEKTRLHIRSPLLWWWVRKFGDGSWQRLSDPLIFLLWHLILLPLLRPCSASRSQPRSDILLGWEERNSERARQRGIINGIISLLCLTSDCYQTCLYLPRKIGSLPNIHQFSYACVCIHLGVPFFPTGMVKLLSIPKWLRVWRSLV